MKEELDRLNLQLSESVDLCIVEIRKVQTAQLELQQLVSEKCGESSELFELVEKFQQNLDLYKEIVRDPVEFIQGVEAGILQDGEELEGEGQDERKAVLVSRALARRHLTPKEEARERENIEIQEQEDEALSNQKQWTNLQTLGVIFIALAILIFAIQSFKRKTSAADILGSEME